MKGKIVSKSPVAIDLEEGKRYAWCSCGESTNQPFCNGSHAGTGMTPNVFTATQTKTVHFCNCKQTSHPDGLCDGSHKSL